MCARVMELFQAVSGQRHPHSSQTFLMNTISNLNYIISFSGDKNISNQNVQFKHYYSSVCGGTVSGQRHPPPPRAVHCGERPADTYHEEQEARTEKVLQTNRGKSLQETSVVASFSFRKRRNPFWKYSAGLSLWEMLVNFGRFCSLRLSPEYEPWLNMQTRNQALSNFVRKDNTVAFVCP